jgi:hypothetical protein
MSPFEKGLLTTGVERGWFDPKQQGGRGRAGVGFAKTKNRSQGGSDFEPPIHD